MSRDHVIGQALADTLPLEHEAEFTPEHEFERQRVARAASGRGAAKHATPRAQGYAKKSSYSGGGAARHSGGGAARYSGGGAARYSGGGASFRSRAAARPNSAGDAQARPGAWAQGRDQRSEPDAAGVRRPYWSYAPLPPIVPPPWLAALLRLIPAGATVAPQLVDPAPPADGPAPGDAAPADAAPGDAAPADAAPADAAPAPTASADAAPAATAAGPAATPAAETSPGAGELVPWLDRALRGELESTSAHDPELRAALARWNLATGVSGAPTFSRLLERWRPVHAPEIPTTLLVAFSRYEASGFKDATHGTRANGYTSPSFYELGVFQVPAGLHGPCTDKGCGLQPPGAESPRKPSPWARLCKRLGLDPKKWDDPTTQVRVGLSNLSDDAKTIRRLYPELFPQKGSDWDLRAAVLLPFVGIGLANTLLKKHRQRLAQLPEANRWSYLSQQAIAADPNKAARMRDLLSNVEKKMKLHETLKAYFARNPGASTNSNPAPAPATATPATPATAATPATSGNVNDASAPSLVGDDVLAFATRLGARWSKRRGGKPSAQELRDWLLKEHRATLTGASARFKNRYPERAITRAWMISVEQQMEFQLGSGSLKSLPGFAPPTSPVVRTTSPLIGGSDKEKVAPVVVNFVRQLQRRFPSFSADTYRGHGGGTFAGKGYSLDLYLNSGRDERGFFKPKAAIEFLRAVGAAARAVNLEWRVLYNDFSVASTINRETGVQRVFFIGKASPSGLNWHGPHPLILHFHLDLGVTRS